MDDVNRRIATAAGSASVYQAPVDWDSGLMSAVSSSPMSIRSRDLVRDQMVRAVQRPNREL